MCCHKTGDTWYFDDITVEKTIELTKWLMQKYNIDAAHVVRHYDVTRKQCPAPFVVNWKRWEMFKSRLIESEALNMTQYEELKKEIEKLQNPMIYNYIDDNMPEFARATIKKLVDKKILNGESNGLNLTYDMLRILVMIDRAGAFDK
jgi:N-acetyl-anhydromuramyl-L-alanine amidase AmpD